MYTANSMNCLCEAIGIALPGNGTIPAVYSKRLQLAKHAGMAIADGAAVKKGITARQIINERSIRQRSDLRYGSGLLHQHRAAPAGYRAEAGVPIDLKAVQQISAKTPNLCHLAPAGPTYMPTCGPPQAASPPQAELAKKGLLDLMCPPLPARPLGEKHQGRTHPE